MSAAILSMLPKKRGRQRQQPDDNRDVLRLFPTHYKGRSFIYAIAFNGNVLKIGQTQNPRGRLTDHWKRGNGEVRWVHVFGSINPRAIALAEQLSLAAVSKVAKQIETSEWFFSEAPREDLIGLIRAAILAAKTETWKKQLAEQERERKRKAVLDLIADSGLLEKLGLQR